PPPDKHSIEVIRTSGVEGSPAEGALTVDEGTSVSYAFTPAAGYGSLQVWLDSTAVSATGTVRMDTSHVLRVTAWPLPEVPSGAGPEAVKNLYTGSNPSNAYQEVLDLTANAVFRGDAAALDALRRAEYAALLQAGPQGMLRVRTALAGKTFMVAGEDDDAALDHAVAGDGLFAEDTIVPTTVIFVNGIFNLEGGASASAQALLAVVREAGFGQAVFSATPNGARPGSTVQVMFHHNPVVSLQSPIDSCILTTAWAYNVAGLADPNASEKNVFARAMDLLSRQLRTAGQCLEMLSTNARVVQQYLDAKLGDLSRPDVQDAGLISLISSERRRGGGRNVIAVGHSQGSMIVRTAVGGAGPGAPHAGCLGAMGIGSPLSTTIGWPNQQWLTRIIARGSEPMSHDILFPLGSNRADGRRSALTDALDANLRADEIFFSIPLRQLALHSFTTSYLAVTGHRGEIRDAVSAGYRALSQACAGRLSGTVLDFETGNAIPGASVSLVMVGRERVSAQTAGDGRFETPAAPPVLYDVIVSASGYRPDTLVQRLVPFNTIAPAQGGPIYLGKDCPRGANQVCDISGMYAGYYQLSGSVNGTAVACAFEATLRLVQTGTSFSGTVTTSRYQRGCDEPGRVNYIHWGQGTWNVSGTVQGDRIVMQHPAIPPWTLTGNAFASGFQVTQPTWLPGNGFRLRVEISGRRTGNAGLAPALNAREGSGTVAMPMSVGGG
ncbi:MAG TPA: carboxypeptidase-like regulatory domain-containing protein, partial [Longimicrobium sp.]